VTLVLGIGGLIAPAPPVSAAAFSRPTNSSPIAISADNKLVWSVNPADNSVAVIRTSDNTLLTKITVDREPRSVAVDPNNSFAFVANAAGNTVSIIRIVNPDPNNFQAGVDEIGSGIRGKLVTGAEPWDIVISPDGNRVFVANSAQDTITVINATTRTILGNIDIRNSVCNDPDRTRHFQPRGMAVTLDNTRLFVTRFLSFTKPGGVQGDDNGKQGAVCQVNINTTSANLSDYQPTALITIGAVNTGFPNQDNSDTFAYPNQLQSIVIRGNRAFLPNIASSPSGPLRFNVDTQAFMSIVTNLNTTPSDGSSLNLNLGARTPESGKTRLFFANLWGVAFTNQSGAGNAYAISAGSDLLVKLIVDAADNIGFTVAPTPPDTISKTTRYIDLNNPADPATSGTNAGKNPLGIVINDAGTTAYTNNFVSRNVSVVDLANDKVIKVIKTADLPAPGSQGERNLVGAEMFFSSRGNFDQANGVTVSTTNRLSSEGWQNCASCHFDGWTDGTVWAFNTGPRKSVPLNGTFNPNKPADDQRVLNYSAIFDEVQDFEANIRNVSGPGPLQQAQNGTTNDPNHGLLFDDDGNVNHAPITLNAFAKPNAGRNQFTVTLPGSTNKVPALDALKEWVQFAVRTPNGRLTTTELIGGGGNPTGAANQSDVDGGRELFVQAGCNTCHGGGKWTISTKDFTSPPAAGDIFTETTPPAQAGTNPAAAQYLNRFLRDIGSFNLGVAGQGNLIGNNVGAVEKGTGGVDGLGRDYNGDGKGVGFNVPSLLGIFHLPPYYHNGSCESLACVLSNQRHRTGNNQFPDVLSSTANQLKVIAFLETIDKDTQSVGFGAPNAQPSCSPRPAVSVNVVRTGAGKVQATIRTNGTGNTLQAIRFNSATNATVTAGGQSGAGNFTITLPAGTTQFQFDVQRNTNNQGVNVPLVITDGCGDWPTLVGLGTDVQ